MAFDGFPKEGITFLQQLWEEPMDALFEELKGLGMRFPRIPASVRYSQKLAPWLLEHTAEAAPLVTWLDAKL